MSVAAASLRGHVAGENGGDEWLGQVGRGLREREREPFPGERQEVQAECGGAARVAMQVSAEPEATAMAISR
jgi:hypothetical protein